MQHQINSFDGARPFALLPRETGGAGFALAARWQSLDDAGRVIASLAGEAEPSPDPHFAARVESVADDRRRAAVQGVDDLSAMIEPGLSALLYVCENGGDARAPAIALWREFSAARASLLALVPSGNS
jgi:hypothetical protein